MQYNSAYDIVVSGDEAGMLEYWSGPSQDYSFPKTVKFEYKTDTDLYEFVKVRLSLHSLWLVAAQGLKTTLCGTNLSYVLVHLQKDFTGHKPLLSKCPS